MNPILAVHKALLGALSGMTVEGEDSSGIPVPVFDAVPQNQPFPYVTLDTHRAREMNALVERRDLRFVFFTVWSTNRGQEQVLRIMQEMAVRLDGVRFELDAGSTVDCRVDDMQTRRDADNVTFSGTLILRLMTHH